MSSDECQKVKVQNYEIFGSSGEKPVKGLQKNVCAVANGLAEKKIFLKVRTKKNLHCLETS